MAIKVYGTYYSPASNRALVVLHEKEVEFELVETSVLEGAQKKPAYLALQVRIPMFVFLDCWAP